MKTLSVDAALFPQVTSRTPPAAPTLSSDKFNYVGKSSSAGLKIHHGAKSRPYKDIPLSLLETIHEFKKQKQKKNFPSASLATTVITRTVEFQNQ